MSEVFIAYNVQNILREQIRVSILWMAILAPNITSDMMYSKSWYAFCEIA